MKGFISKTEEKLQTHIEKSDENMQAYIAKTDDKMQAFISKSDEKMQQAVEDAIDMQLTLCCCVCACLGRPEDSGSRWTVSMVIRHPRLGETSCLVGVSPLSGTLLVYSQRLEAFCRM